MSRFIPINHARTVVARSVARLLAVMLALTGCADTNPTALIPVGSVSFAVQDTAMQVGRTQQLTVVVKSANGTTLTDRAVTWSSSDVSAATVSSTGLVTALQPGTVTISATSEGKSAAAAITIVASVQIVFSISVQKLFVGDTANISWTATYAGACTASGAWTGSLPASGTRRYVAAEGGVKRFTLQCSGPGGTRGDSIPLIVPFPVYSTSYENKNRLAFDRTQVPTVRGLDIPRVAADQNSNERSVAFADFLGKGSVSAFVSSTRSTNRFPELPRDFSDSPGIGYFLSINAQNQWIDRSAELFASPEDRWTCVSVSYSLVADFNGDKKPDIWMACSGLDVADFNIFPVEQQRDVATSEQVVLLSTPNGTYRRQAIPERLYGHHAAAADFNGDGHVDVLSTDAMNVRDRLPVMFLGDGRGGFSRNDLMIPSSLVEMTRGTGAIWNLWAIPRSADAEEASRSLLMVFGSFGNTFISQGFQNGILAESYSDVAVPQSARTNVRYEFPLDVVLHNNALIMHQTASYADGTDWAILRYTANGASPEVLELWNNPYSNFQPYAAQIKPTSDGFLVAYTGGCQRPEILNLQGRCLLRLRIP